MQEECPAVPDQEDLRSPACRSAELAFWLAYGPPLSRCRVPIVLDVDSRKASGSQEPS